MIGAFSGSNNNGDQCSFFGADAGPAAASTYNNSTALGYNTTISADNQVRVGNSAVTSIGGFAFWTNLSDQRFKHQLQEDVPGLDFILQLRPLTYQVKMQELANALHEDERSEGKLSEQYRAETLAHRNAKAAIRHTGFLAQEVEAAAKKIGYDFSGVDVPQNEESFYGLRYAAFTVPLVKAVQEQQASIEDLKKENARLRADNDALKARLDKIEAVIKQMN